MDKINTFKETVLKPHFAQIATAFKAIRALTEQQEVIYDALLENLKLKKETEMEGFVYDYIFNEFLRESPPVE